MFDARAYAEIGSVDFVKGFLRKLVKKIKMRAISEPLVVYHEDKDEMESGVTGTIILAESNITIHTYPKKNFIFLDIFSCKEFEISNTIKYLVKELDVKEYKQKVVRRSVI